MMLNETNPDATELMRDALRVIADEVSEQTESTP